MRKLFGILLFLFPAILRADPPILTDDPDSPKQNGWEIFAGAVVEKRDRVLLMETPSVEIEYGVLDSLQITFQQAWITRASEHQGTQNGIGDSLAGVKWRFLDQDTSGVSVSVYPQFSFNDSNRSVNLGLVTKGWQMILPVEVQRKFGGTILMSEFGYTWREQSSNGLLYGLAVEQEINEKFSLLAELHGESAIRFLEGVLVFDLGFRWQTSEHVALIGSAGRALYEGSRSAPDFIGYLGLQFAY